MAFGKTPQNADKEFQNLRVAQHGVFNQLSAENIYAETIDTDSGSGSNVPMGNLTAPIIDALQYYELQNSEVLSSVEPGSLAVGFGTAIPNATGTGNTSVGTNALSSDTSGLSNTAVGNSALQLNNTGSDNTAQGFGALSQNTLGNSNTAMGCSSLAKNSTGIGNTAQGQGALYSNTTGSANTAQGQSALYQSNGDDNTAVGTGALQSLTTGSANCALGQGADVSSGNVSNSIILGAGGTSSLSGQLVIHGTVSGVVTMSSGVVTIPSNALTSNTIVMVTRLGIYTSTALGLLSTEVTSNSIIVHSLSPQAPTTIETGDNSVIAFFAFEP
jgi:hypothetical protein